MVQAGDLGLYWLWHHGENESVNDIEFQCIPGRVFIKKKNSNSVTRLPPDTGLILDFIMYVSLFYCMCMCESSS